MIITAHNLSKNVHLISNEDVMKAPIISISMYHLENVQFVVQECRHSTAKIQVVNMEEMASSLKMC
jgi:hypothetical protein